jgi:hypothetical protein
LEQAKPYLETRPFIVPPVLTKSELVEHPLLNVLWTRAYDLLASAESTVFIGYSLPMTDVGGGFLFREAWHGRDVGSLTVVDFAAAGEEEEKAEVILASYRAVFPAITRDQVELCGASRWIEHHVR